MFTALATAAGGEVEKWLGWKHTWRDRTEYNREAEHRVFYSKNLTLSLLQTWIRRKQGSLSPGEWQARLFLILG